MPFERRVCLQTAVANIADNTGVNGKRGDFEAAVAYLLSKDPVVKRKQLDSVRPAGEISDAKADVSDFGTKPVIGICPIRLVGAS
jgi:hypothetical protein